EHLAPTGRVMEVLSEHQCQGWLEGYLLTGRHGMFASYEAFIHIVDSMVNQHAKWLKVSEELEWRRPLASLNYLLSSHVWRQDHNGFSHQDPGFIDHVVNKKAEFVRVYLPPDANTLLSTYDHCLRSRHYINVVVAGKQPNPNWLTMDEAVVHCTRGLGIWEWAGTEEPGQDPDVVLACAGDIPTIETLAAAKILRQQVPGLKVRVINVVDLMRLQDDSEHPHGLSQADFEGLFGQDIPVVFAYHGYPWLIHRLAYRHDRHSRIHVRGYKEEGTTTTPFDMLMLNDADRLHLGEDVIDRGAGLATRYGGRRQARGDGRTRSTGSRAWPHAMPGCVSRWRTSGSGPAPMPISTGPTSPMWPSGSGRRAPPAPPQRLPWPIPGRTTDERAICAAPGSTGDRPGPGCRLPDGRRSGGRSARSLRHHPQPPRRRGGGRHRGPGRAGRGDARLAADRALQCPRRAGRCPRSRPARCRGLPGGLSAARRLA